MGRIVYKNGDLFKGVPKNAIIAHACNGYGVWGGGFAAQCADRFPKANAMYSRICKANGRHVLGTTFLVGENPDDGERTIACLVTSMGYGFNKYASHESVDPIQDIAVNTDSAIERFFELLPQGAEVHSPKLNAGLFGTPWGITEAILESWLEKRPDITWVVWEWTPPMLAFPFSGRSIPDIDADLDGTDND